MRGGERRWGGRALTAALPLVGALLLGVATMEGWLSLGGGEKDVLLIIPLVAWALVFAVASLLLQATGVAPRKAAAIAAVLGGVLLVAMVIGVMVLAR